MVRRRCEDLITRPVGSVSLWLLMQQQQYSRLQRVLYNIVLAFPELNNITWAFATLLYDEIGCLKGVRSPDCAAVAAFTGLMAVSLSITPSWSRLMYRKGRGPWANDANANCPCVFLFVCFNLFIINANAACKDTLPYMCTWLTVIRSFFWWLLDPKWYEETQVQQAFKNWKKNIYIYIFMSTLYKHQ